MIGHQVGERDGCQSEAICHQAHWLWPGGFMQRTDPKTQPLKIDTIHIFNQRVSMVNLLQTLIAVRGHYPRSAHPAYAECGQGLEVWELQLWAYMLHDCLQTDTCVSQMELRSWGHKKSHILESSGAVPLCSNSRCSTFAAAEAKTLTTTSVYTPPEVKAKTAVPFSEVLRSIFSMGFWPRCSCPWHGRNKDVRFFWLRESHEVFLLTLTSCHWYVLQDNRQQR